MASRNSIGTIAADEWRCSAVVADFVKHPLTQPQREFYVNALDQTHAASRVVHQSCCHQLIDWQFDTDSPLTSSMGKVEFKADGLGICTRIHDRRYVGFASLRPHAMRFGDWPLLTLWHCRLHGGGAGGV